MLLEPSLKRYRMGRFRHNNLSEMEITESKLLFIVRQILRSVDEAGTLVIIKLRLFLFGDISGGNRDSITFP